MKRRLESRTEVLRAIGADIGLLTQAVALANVESWEVEDNVVRAKTKPSESGFDLGMSILGRSGKVLEVIQPGKIAVASLVADVATVSDLDRKAVERKLAELISGERFVAGKTRFTLRYKENDAAAEIAAHHNATHSETSLTHAVPKDSVLAMPKNLLVDSGIPEKQITSAMFEAVAGTQSTVISAAGRRNLIDYLLDRLDKTTWGSVAGGYVEVAVRTRLQNSFDPDQLAAFFKLALMNSVNHKRVLMDENVKAIGEGSSFHQGVFALHMTLDQLKNFRAVHTPSIRMYRAFTPVVSR